MGWNESGNGKNPWGGGKNPVPPDLDDVIRNLQNRLSALFGGRRRGGEGSGAKGLSLVMILIVVGWVMSGFYKVDASERGIVLRFGEHVNTTMAGLRWHIPWPIESVEQVNVARFERVPITKRMLTSDENIVEVDLVVQYQRTDAEKFLFKVRDAEATVSDVAESAIREVVGKNNMDFTLTEGRAEISRQTKELMQTTLDAYNTGIQIFQVNLQDVNFPDQVQDSVQDAIKAREDKDRLSLEAEAYANDIVPKARGAAARQIQDAEAYRERVIADSEGEASRFTQLLAEYEKAPEVTRERLYLESIESVYEGSAKVLMDTEGSGNLVYLPIDKLLEQRSRRVVPEATFVPQSGGGNRESGSDLRERESRESARSRGTR